MDANQKSKLYEKYNLSSGIDTKFYEVTPKSWGELKEYFNYLQPSYIFRGQASNRWKLITTIERAAVKSEYSPDQIWKSEKEILKEFKARAHHFINSPPNNNDNLEWLSLIQDFGGPTRLLDFTESFYIASYFAVEPSNEDACVWAINGYSLQFLPHFINALGDEEIFPDTYENTHDVGTSDELVQFAEKTIVDPSDKPDIVLLVKPPRLNERLAVQRGLFLFSCNFSKSFEYNLCKTLGFSFDSLDKSNTDDSKDLLRRLEKLYKDKQLDINTVVIKFNIPTSLYKEALQDLNKMNINSASLFPGLEGFAKSLNHLSLFSRSSVTVKVEVRDTKDKSNQSSEENLAKGEN